MFANNSWIEVDNQSLKKITDFSKLATDNKFGFFVIPGTVRNNGEASSKHVLEMQTIMVDIDTGNTEEKLQKLKELVARPTLIVESGGVTKDGFKKLHVYWQFLDKVSGENLQKLADLRHKLALGIGGDLHFKSLHQPIRVAGSTYHKDGVNKLVKIRSYSRLEYEFEAIREAIEKMPIPEEAAEKNNSKTVNSAKKNPIGKLLIDKTCAGGDGENTRFNAISRVTGYFFRRYFEGYITEEEAVKEIYDYNLSNVVPSLSERKLASIIHGIKKIHLKKYGEVNSEDNNIEFISPKHWKGMPPNREWVIKNWLPKGCVTALYGDGGTGKSLLAQQLATCVSTGKYFLGNELKPMRVVVLMCEDNFNELWRRQYKINQHYNIKYEQLENIRFISREGKNNLLMSFDNNNVGYTTKFFNKLHKEIIKFKPDLVILDTAADFFSGNENNRVQVRHFIQTTLGCIARDINGAVLICAHPSESGMQKGTGSCGSTAWNNTVRSRWYLTRPDSKQYSKDYLILSRVKSNYAPSGEIQYLKLNDSVFELCRMLGSTDDIHSDNNIDDTKTRLILDLIRSEALKGRLYTMNQFADTLQGSKHGLGSKRSITSRVSKAADKGVINYILNPQEFGINLCRSTYGYICVEDMKLKISSNPEKMVYLFPTHYKNSLDSKLYPIESKMIQITIKKEAIMTKFLTENCAKNRIGKNNLLNQNLFNVSSLLIYKKLKTRQELSKIRILAKALYISYHKGYRELKTWQANPIYIRLAIFIAYAYA
ncbi:MAG: AAA family ATPase [Rickettsiaceae bacterium]|nr:AAA family ATPase [Rickettsiaceae bacterium]